MVVIENKMKHTKVIMLCHKGKLIRRNKCINANGCEKNSKK